jgi:hypothetical protein
MDQWNAGEIKLLTIEGLHCMNEHRSWICRRPRSTHNCYSMHPTIYVDEKSITIVLKAASSS